MFLFFISSSCKKEEPEVTYPYHCVADSFDCRKGKWANTYPNKPSADTIEFHTSTKFSNYYYDDWTEERRGIIWQEYRFDGTALVTWSNPNGFPVSNPFHYITSYNEETEILSFHNMGSTNDLIYEYKRIP